jgi:pyridoxal phosphate enzyme (YggS family)
MSLNTRLSDNLLAVRQRIAQACARCGREADEVQLVAVTKYAPWPAVLELAELGCRSFGESRPQQLLQRAELLPGVDWHLIGHLQRNKVRGVLPAVTLIHSVDSWRLLERIEAVAEELQLAPRVLLEVNVSGEASKDGFDPDELQRGWGLTDQLVHTQVCGLMTMAPLTDEPEVARPVFRQLKRLRDELASRSPQLALRELSMGMSHDFEIAIEEGATLVRIGSSLFEGVE